jgi:hypothetical protein
VRSITRAVGLAAGSAGLLFAAACGSSGTTHGSAAAGNAADASSAGTSGGDVAQIDLCTLLTATQIQQAIGQPVGPGKKADAPGVGCGWIDQNTGNNSNVGVLYVDPTVYQGTKQAAGQNGVTMTKVAGIGDEAYAETLSPTATPLLFVKKGSVIVSVSADIRVSGSNDQASPAQDLAAERQLAAIIAASL